MGSKVSVKMKEESDDLDSEIEELDVPWTEGHYPLPKPPSTKASEVFNAADYKAIDERSIKCPSSATKSYESLLNYLLLDLVTDMEKLRAIYSWLGSQNIPKWGSKSTDWDSPAGYMRLMKLKRGSYSAFFALLLRRADIPCVIVYGISKSVDYEVGDRDIFHLRNCWNAVYVGGEWYLIHPLWAFRKIRGFNKGCWRAIRKETGKQTAEDEKAEYELDGTDVSSNDEFFFLVDPEVFVFMCRPAADMSAWQLLKNPWTFEEFIHAPVLKQKFLEHKLSLLSKRSCILHADTEGHVQITIEDLEKPEMYLTHEIYFDDRASFNKLPADINLERYAFISRNRTRVTIQARLPVGGIYKLKVYGGVDAVYHLCDFRLECEMTTKFPKPFPFSKKLQYGFTKNTQMHGLDDPSEFGGVVRLQSGQGKIFTFSYKLELDIQVILEHNTLSRDTMKKCVAVKRVDGYFNVYVNVPTSAKVEEYSLQAYTRKKGSSNPFTNTVNYLIVMDRRPDTPRKPSRQTGEHGEVEARRHLKTATEKSNINELENAIQTVQRLQLDSDQDLREAKRKRELLILERDLRLAIARRRSDLLDRVLDKAGRLSCDHRLEYLVREACDIKDQLARLKTFLRDVLEIKQTTISEMHNYNRPKEVIHDVMIATYLLLGEERDDLKGWVYVQHLMRKVGRNSLVSRLRKFDIITVQLDMVEEVQSVLEKYDEAAVTQASSGAGTFYIWCQHIIVELTVSIHNEIQKYMARRN